MASKFLSNSISTFPSFWKGVARLADPMGNLDSIDTLSATSDREALNQDWVMIGKDLTMAIENYETSTRAPKKNS